MPAPIQSALADEQAFALHERSGAMAYGMDREQFAAMLRDIQGKYLPQATPQEAADFCGSLRLEELVLARACAAGDERAWQDFISRYRNKLRAMALHITRDAASASELADSLFADLYGVNARDGVRHSKLTFYTARGSLEGWLRTVMAQEFINRYRKTKRDVSLDEQEEEGRQFVAPTPAVAATADDRLESATDEALAELSAEDRYVLAAYHLDGRTLAEIARVLKLHESSISRRLDRVTATLRKRILACLRDRGMSHSQAKEALETDVRDVQLDLRKRLAQDSRGKAFPGGKAPAPRGGTGGSHV